METLIVEHASHVQPLHGSWIDLSAENKGTLYRKPPFDVTRPGRLGKLSALRLSSCAVIDAKRDDKERRSTVQLARVGSLGERSHGVLRACPPKSNGSVLDGRYSAAAGV